jgi:hypothetical protein
MPEGSEVLMLVLAMLAMGFAVYRSPKLKQQLQA